MLGMVGQAAMRLYDSTWFKHDMGRYTFYNCRESWFSLSSQEVWQYPPWAYRGRSQGSDDGGKGKHAKGSDGGKGKRAKGSKGGGKGKNAKGLDDGGKGKRAKGSDGGGKGDYHGRDWMDSHGGVYVAGGYIYGGVFHPYPALQIRSWCLVQLLIRT